MLNVTAMLRNKDIVSGLDMVIDTAKRDGVTLDAATIKARAIGNGHTREAAEQQASLVLARMRQRGMAA